MHAQEWLTRREVAELARVSVATVDRAIRAGELRASKVRGRVRIHDSWVAAWLLALEAVNQVNNLL